MSSHFFRGERGGVAYGGCGFSLVAEGVLIYMFNAPFFDITDTFIFSISSKTLFKLTGSLFIFFFISIPLLALDFISMSINILTLSSMVVKYCLLLFDDGLT